MLGQGAITRLLIFNPQSRALGPDTVRRLEHAFPEHERRPIQEGERVERVLAGLELAPEAEVVVVGGDGTVEAAARALAGTGRSLAVIPSGTFNNFARALGLDQGVEAAIDVARQGEPRPVTVGWVNDFPFLEIAAVGALGEMLNLGEDVKELHYGDLWPRMGRVMGTTRFRFRVTGSEELVGMADSLVFSNTPTVGALLPIGDGNPRDGALRLEVVSRATGLQVLGRLAGQLVGRRAGPASLAVRLAELTTDPVLPVYADTVRVADTPVTVRAEPGALRVVLPRA